MPRQKAASKYPGGACTARLLPATLPTAVPAARPAAMRQSTFPSLRAGGGGGGRAASTHARHTIVKQARKPTLPANRPGQHSTARTRRPGQAPHLWCCTRAAEAGGIIDSSEVPSTVAWA